MQFDLTKRKTENPRERIFFMKCWLLEQKEKIRRVIPEEKLSDQDLQNYLINVYKTRKKDSWGRLYNNTNNSNTKVNVETYINKYLSDDLILSGYNCLFKDHKNSMNIIAMAIDTLLKNRKANKNKMEAAEHGSDEYLYYKVVQLMFKVLANSVYGILGEKNSIFFNPFIQNSITLTGQDLITTSIISMECFLENNFYFRNIDDFITYVNNILDENSKFSILEYLDTPKTKDEVIKYFVRKFPSETNGSIVERLVNNLSDEDVNRIYWKNNTREILNHSYFKNTFEKIAQYEYFDKVNPEVADEMAALKERVIEFCFYNYLFYDKYIRSLEDKRDVICTIDTDSNFININGLVLDMKRRLNKVDCSQQENITFVNIFVNIVTEALEKTFWKLTGNMGISEPIRPKINMKNEFVYKKLLLTENKKSYGGIIISELGKLLKKPATDIKGLSIRKTTLAKKLRVQLTDLLTNDILKPDKINLKQILNKFDIIEDGIRQSLKSGSMEYALPKNIELISNYANPASLEPVRGTIIWNALEPNEQIIPPEKVNMLKLVATTPDHPALLKLQETHPDKYQIIMNICFNPDADLDISKFGFSAVSIPKSVEKIPDYLMDLIDYENMVNLNVSNGYILLKSLGIHIASLNDATKYKSNIIEL